MNVKDTFETFEMRHIGPREADLAAMLKTVNADSIDDLISQTVPDAIRLDKPLALPDGQSEAEYLRELNTIAKKNKLFKTYIGLGYYNTFTPGVILRNIFENPGWYTQYTPYQAEISQGRLEALLNFQTMVSELTGMDLANASLLDEATAAAEAMALCYRQKNKRTKTVRHKFFVADHIFTHTLDVLKSRAEPLGIEIVVADPTDAQLDGTFFGMLLQLPAANGALSDYTPIIEQSHASDCMVVIAADLMASVLTKSPGSMGADIVVGSVQRFGIPLGYGGPHPAYFATSETFARDMPGRIIGVSVDADGNPALRMALQTREQHIKRAKATSNICTAQALLAIMAGMYGVYHGPQGLRNIARSIHRTTTKLAQRLEVNGYTLASQSFFDTLTITGGPKSGAALKAAAEAAQINLFYPDENTVQLSIDETTNLDDLNALIALFGGSGDVSLEDIKDELANIPAELQRQDDFMGQKVFNSNHSEHDMLRYIKRLEQKDLSLCTSMISLGSCTMKLNATSEMIPVTWAKFSQLHPFVPLEQAQGYQYVIDELSRMLCEITGFAGISLQPNSGAQGEYAGLMAIRACLRDKGQGHRNIALIPSSAHGTNPASAAMAGMTIVVVKCDDEGNIDVADLNAKAEKHADNLASLMITYPSTHGVFEETVVDICATIHKHGGMVYMDGANMNAQVGLTNPARIGADVCHLNLHKTFAIPHGGGGPGMGPICVTETLKPYLPGHSIVPIGGEKAQLAMAAAPYSSASILLISYAYIKMLGRDGVTNATKYAILNANYIKSRLEGHYTPLYTGTHDRVAHEMIIDLRDFKAEAGVEVIDVAKRLMDYGFHAPTVSWPVPGTMMIEPTESEPKEELDRFCDALIAIRKEIQAIADGKSDKEHNPLKHAPHTSVAVVNDTWDKPYSRETAAFPLPYVRAQKFWPSVARINDLHGDRNLVCSCAPLEAYENEEA